MEIYASLKDNMEIRPCPFCGSREDLRIGTVELFNIIKEVHGRAKVSMQCERCRAEMSAYSFEIDIDSDYAVQKELLFKKWNKRR